MGYLTHSLTSLITFYRGGGWMCY